jgi:hypothetical protein
MAPTNIATQTMTAESQPISRQEPDPSKIMQVGMGFWASKTLLAAVRLRLFTILSGVSLSGTEIREKLQLNTTQRHVYDWLDTLVSLGFLQRDGILDAARYCNAPDTGLFLDKNNPAYIGGMLEMANNRLYRFWGDLEEGLMTGHAQNESKQDTNMHFLNQLYKDPVKLREFMDAMAGIQAGNFRMLVQQFNFSQYRTVADIGGADALLSVMIALHHPSVHIINFDLPAVEPLARERITRAGVEERISLMSGDFLQDDLPSAEVIVMGNILHGCNEEGKTMLIKKVYDALPQQGAFIAVENIIDNQRQHNTFGLLMSLNMLIENGDAFDYTFLDFEGWVKKAGFRQTQLLPLAGPASAAIAYK